MSRPRVGRRTLQFRMTAGLIVLLAVASLTIAAATAVGLQAYLVDQLDRELTASWQRAEEFLHQPAEGDERGSGQSDIGEVPGLTAGTIAVRMSPGAPPRSAYVIASGSVALGASDAATLAALPADGVARTRHLTKGSYRLVSVSTRDGGTLVVGVPVEDLERTMSRLLAVEAVVFVAVIAAAGTAGGLFVGRSLAPLRSVAGTARSVVGQHLGSGAVQLPERVTGVEPASEVGQVAEALNLLLDHVEASFAQRQATEEQLRRFVADASHELRTPVAVISGYAELARRQRGELPAEVARALDRIGSEAGRMAVLVDDLLLLARLDAGRPLAREPVDLTLLVLDVAEDARIAGPEHRWLLDLPEEPLVVEGDGLRLHQVLANLASNARVHTPAGTAVTIGLTSPEPGWVRLNVTDDGPGIPQDLQERLFDRFVRGEASRSRTAGSTGLGLAIVAAVVAAHRGRVEVDSSAGRTRFSILLPS